MALIWIVLLGLGLMMIWWSLGQLKILDNIRGQNGTD